MIKQSFNAGWLAGPKQSAFASFSGAAPDIRPVTLPYDALRDQPRSAGSAQGSHTAYYPGGQFEYTKTFDVPAEWRDKTVIFEFEGVYRDAMVYINGEFAAQRPNGYAGFAIKADPYLRYGQPNTIAVQYAPGELVAVASTAGKEQARTMLLTANDSLRVHAAADRTAIRADDTDLAYIAITLQDADGTLANHRDRPVVVTVDGSGVLAGLGTGRPSTEETFHAATRTTYDGRALAIVRPTGVGDITVTVSAEGLEPVTLNVRTDDDERIGSRAERAAIPANQPTGAGTSSGFSK
jgi:beta-galactosidase